MSIEPVVDGLLQVALHPEANDAPGPALPARSAFAKAEKAGVWIATSCRGCKRAGRHAPHPVRLCRPDLSPPGRGGSALRLAAGSRTSEG